MYDNASAEILLSRYKAELLEGSAFRDLTEAQMETSDYIERYYNPERRHSALGYISSDEYERAYSQRIKPKSATTEKGAGLRCVTSSCPSQNVTCGPVIGGIPTVLCQ